jgi:predicted transcriptional regulator
MPYRDRTEIIRQILDIANGGNATRIKIMYRAFLSHKQVKEYVALLTERDLVRYDPITQTYKTTEKGFRLLQFCNELEGMMRNGLQSPRPSA